MSAWSKVWTVLGTGQLVSKLYSYQVTSNLKFATGNIFTTSVQCRQVLRGCLSSVLLFNSFMNNQNFNGIFILRKSVNWM